MSAAGYVWRVEGEWPPPGEIAEGYPPNVTRRHYLTLRAAEHRAHLWRTGFEAPDGVDDVGAEMWLVVPPAQKVTVTRSLHIEWPAAEAPTSSEAASPVSAAVSREECRGRPRPAG